MRWASNCTPTLSVSAYRSLLRACARENSIHVGKKLHAIITTTGLAATPNTFLRNTLFHMYAACGDVCNARKLFDQIHHLHKDTVDWTTVIGCLSRHGLTNEAINLFIEMRKNGVKPDDLTLVCFLNACARLGDSLIGAQGHGCMIKIGIGSSVKSCNTMMDLYVKCGLISEAKRMFDEIDNKSVVSWTVLLNGVVKCEGVEHAIIMFDEMPERNEVAWTIMIVSYIENGFTEESFMLLSEMIFDVGFELNHVTLCSLLSASTQLGNLMMGKWVHVYAIKTMKKEINTMVGTSLVDMYAKCGRINSAIRVFNTMTQKNIVSWNAMLNGYAMHGYGKALLDIFTLLIKEAKPDEVTLTAILSACSHAGLVDQGSDYFYNMKTKYGVIPNMEHYACMVDLYGRAGRVEEAESLIYHMPIRPNEVVLGSLLGSCYIHGKIQIAERALKHLIQFDPNNTKYHILLSNMYALQGNREKANFLRNSMKKRGIKKTPGMSCVHVNGQPHRFTAGDKSHPRTDEIYAKLDEMIRRLRLAGYVPNMSLHVFSGWDNDEDDVDVQEEKEQALFSHSEKLAICFGLISTGKGVALHIFKNIRICQDCHSAIKIVSEIYDREIVVRDRNRFHCFKHGLCSCSDYW